MANGEAIELATNGVTIEQIEPDWRTRVLMVITDPNIAYILMLIGLYGLVYEFLNPGFFIPGVIGSICLLLGLYSLQMLPINYAGLALIILGILFMIFESIAPSFGILGVGGIIAFIIGSFILLDKSGYAISIPLILANAAVSAGFFIWVLGMMMRIRRRPLVSGQEHMQGGSAQVCEDFSKEGYVFVEGERWRAITSAPVHKGQEVNVTAVDGLTLHVSPR